MVKLYDASILTGPKSLTVGAMIMPEGREGAAHEISASLQPLDLRPAVPGYLSPRDVVVLNGTEYAVSQVQYVQLYVEYTGGGTDYAESAVLIMSAISDPTNEVRLWVPFDEDHTRQTLKAGKTVGRMYVQQAEFENALPWSFFDADDNFRIDVTCFATGTLIQTGDGPRPVHLLRVGDMVDTRDHGLQPLRWLGGRRLSAADLAANPKLEPIRIAAGALGAGMPARDLTVSPQHRMLVRSVIAERMTGSAEVLIAAVQLLGHPGIERVQAPDGVGYWHLMFDCHEIVFAEGAEAESLYLGPMALSAMTDDAVAELRTLFPDLVGPDRHDPPPTARPVMRGKPVRKLIERQVRNFKPLVAPV